MQERYIKWIPRLNRCAPGYLIREEKQIRKICIEMEDRVVEYEKEIKSSCENSLLKEYRREMGQIDWVKTK